LVPNVKGDQWSTIASVTCATSTLCLAVGSYGGDYGVVLTSSDAGLTWQVAANDASVGYRLSSVSCTSATTCLAAGDDTPTPARGEPGAGIFRTVDGGGHWTEIASPGFNATQISCLGQVCQELATTPPWFGPPTTALETSSDGGVTWTTPLFPHDVAFGGVTSTPAGRWILVGGDIANGALIASSP